MQSFEYIFQSYNNIKVKKKIISPDAHFDNVLPAKVEAKIFQNLKCVDKLETPMLKSKHTKGMIGMDEGDIFHNLK